MLKFAQRVNSMKGSAARAMLNITRKPGVISFAGGLPAPELFPVEEYAKVAQSVIQDNGSDAYLGLYPSSYKNCRTYAKIRGSDKDGRSYGNQWFSAGLGIYGKAVY